MPEHHTPPSAGSGSDPHPTDASTPLHSEPGAFDGGEFSAVGRAVRAEPDHGPEAEARRRADVAATLQLPPHALASLDPDALAAAERAVRRMEARIHELEARVAVDDLTGALRRGAGLQALDHEIARARRHDIPLTIAFVDVDGLKRVNDTLGHAEGDRLLRVVAEALERTTRVYDVVLRYGGDEFVCILPGCDQRGAERVLTDARAVVAELTQGRSISVGLAVLAPGDDTASLLARADSALYAARGRSSTATATRTPADR